MSNLIEKLRSLSPRRAGMFRQSAPNFLNLHFANGSRATLSEWQGLFSYYSTAHLFEPGFDALFAEAAARDPHVPPHLVRLRIFFSLQFSAVAMQQPGDLLFCGVSYGVAAFAIMKHHRDLLRDRTCFLVDPFEGANSRADRSKRAAYGADAEEIGRTFSALGRAVVIRDYIPDATAAIGAKSICFAHLNTSDAESEIPTIDWIAARMPPGGVILIDAFGTWHPGAHGYAEKFDRLGYISIPLMNGQAACFKHP